MAVLIQLVIVLLVIGVLFYLVETLNGRFDPTLKLIIRVILIVILAIWLLRVLNVVVYPMPLR